MPRFAVLTHDHPTLHWDFLLESGETCRTWRLAEEPGVGWPIEAEAIANHRLVYLDYEGPVGGNRGSVTHWDRGQFEFLREASGEWTLRLSGERYLGDCRLRRVSGNHWRIEFGPE